MKKIAIYLKSFKGSIILIMILVFVQSLAEVFLPTLMAEIVNKGIVNNDIPYILNTGKYMLAIGSHGAFLWKLDQKEQYDILKGSKPVGGMFLEDSSKLILMSRDISVWKIQDK